VGTAREGPSWSVARLDWLGSAPPTSLVAECCFIAVSIGADMTPETDENGGDPRGTLASPAPASTPTATGQKDAGRATTVVPIALGLMLGVAYLGYAHLKTQIEEQHAGFVTQLQPLKHKIQEVTAAQSQTDAEIAKLVAQSPPPKNEIQGLQNHIITPRGQPKQRKK
jgi:hypothetical protein